MKPLYLKFQEGSDKVILLYDTTQDEVFKDRLYSVLKTYKEKHKGEPLLVFTNDYISLTQVVKEYHLHDVIESLLDVVFILPDEDIANCLSRIAYAKSYMLKKLQPQEEQEDIDREEDLVKTIAEEEAEEEEYEEVYEPSEEEEIEEEEELNIISEILEEEKPSELEKVRSEILDIVAFIMCVFYDRLSKDLKRPVLSRIRPFNLSPFYSNLNVSLTKVLFNVGGGVSFDDLLEAGKAVVKGEDSSVLVKLKENVFNLNFINERIMLSRNEVMEFLIVRRLKGEEIDWGFLRKTFDDPEVILKNFESSLDTYKNSLKSYIENKVKVLFIYPSNIENVQICEGFYEKVLDCVLKMDFKKVLSAKHPPAELLTCAFSLVKDEDALKLFYDKQKHVRLVDILK